jgi:DNA-binding response OmpR family regulator
LSPTEGVLWKPRSNGRLVLIAEDEPLIALDITLAFEKEGAWVIRARILDEALHAVEDPTLSAAILDHALCDGWTYPVSVDS